MDCAPKAPGAVFRKRASATFDDGLMVDYRGLVQALSATTAVEEALADLERRRIQATVEADIHTLREIFADELIYNHSGGGRDSKTSLLEKLGDGILDYLEIDAPDQEIVVAGQTAIITGRMIARVRVGGVLRTPDNKTLAVWILRDGRWQFLAFQAAALPRS